MKKMIIALSISIISGVAMAVEPVVVDSATKLDIQKVISQTTPNLNLPEPCGMTEQTITYIDSKGVLTQTTYKVQGTGCNG